MVVYFELENNESASVAQFTVQNLIACGYAVEIVVSPKLETDQAVAALKAMAARPAARTGKKATINVSYSIEL